MADARRLFGTRRQNKGAEPRPLAAAQRTLAAGRRRKAHWPHKRAAISPLQTLRGTQSTFSKFSVQVAHCVNRNKTMHNKSICFGNEAVIGLSGSPTPRVRAQAHEHQTLPRRCGGNEASSAGWGSPKRAQAPGQQFWPRHCPEVVTIQDEPERALSVCGAFPLGKGYKYGAVDRASDSPSFNVRVALRAYSQTFSGCVSDLWLAIWQLLSFLWLILWIPMTRLASNAPEEKKVPRSLSGMTVKDDDDSFDLWTTFPINSRSAHAHPVAQSGTASALALMLPKGLRSIPSGRSPDVTHQIASTCAQENPESHLDVPYSSGSSSSSFCINMGHNSAASALLLGRAQTEIVTICKW